MKNKINIAELLKDCPKGMELDCTMLDNIIFERVDVNPSSYPIVIRNIKTNKTIHLTKYGQFVAEEGYKCVIFPKGKTTWEGFVPPCKFKDGDILSYQCGILNNRTIYIYRYNEVKNTSYYVALSGDIHSTFRVNDDKEWTLDGYNDTARLATEEEKKKLFDAIKDNGYKWNSEKKTLEKLDEPKFHEGKWIMIDKPCQIISIRDNGNYIVRCCDDEKMHELSKKFCESYFHLWTLKDAKNGDVIAFDDSTIVIFKDLYNKTTFHSYCHIEDGVFAISKDDCPDWWEGEAFKPATEEQRNLLFQKIKEAGYRWNEKTKTLEKLIRPEFKVLDKIRHKDDETVITITGIKDDYYFIQYYNERRNDYQNGKVWFKDQDRYELIPKKFDITTLKPFESRVLVRNYNNDVWRAAFWGCLIDSKYGFKYDTTRGYYKQCIPYERNPYLLGKTEDCNDYYKTWE